MICSNCGKEIHDRAQIQRNNKKVLCRECEMKEKKRRLREKITSANYPRGEGKFGIDPFYV